MSAGISRAARDANNERGRVAACSRVRAGARARARDSSSRALVKLLVTHAVAHVDDDRAAEEQVLELVGVADRGRVEQVLVPALPVSRAIRAGSVGIEAALCPTKVLA